MARRVRTRLPLGPAAGAGGRRFVEEFGSDLEPSSLECLRLLVTEVVNNSVQHSGRPEGENILVTMELHDDRVFVEVMDRGAGLPRPPPSPSAGRESGWGLYLVDRLADRWGFTTEAPTRIWFEVVRRPKPQARAFGSAIGALVVLTA